MKKLISGKGATLALIVSSLAIIALVACIGSAGPQGLSGQSGPQGTTGNISSSGSANPLVSDADSFPVDTTKFDLSSLVAINEEDCTLSNGDSSNCYQITVTGFPSDRDELGPFCPETITTGAESAGKWFDNGVLYVLTGDFVANLDNFYNDNHWQLFDQDTGKVNITKTQAAFEAAARPDVDPEYNNFCVQGDISWYSDVQGEGVEVTYLIPATPVSRSSAGSIGRSVGIALNGVGLDGAAPTQAILSAYTIAAFDDCVGHINPVAGYHYHGANHGEDDCPAIAHEGDGHSGAFAYALDGYVIHTMLNINGEEETDLDNCRGHVDTIRGYHYHAAGPGENAFISCFTGEIAQGFGGQQGPPPGGQGGNPPPRPQDGGPDLAKAASILGVTENTLRNALGARPPDLTAAAKRLGITEQVLRKALGLDP